MGRKPWECNKLRVSCLLIVLFYFVEHSSTYSMCQHLFSLPVPQSCLWLWRGEQSGGQDGKLAVWRARSGFLGRRSCELARLSSRSSPLVCTVSCGLLALYMPLLVTFRGGAWHRTRIHSEPQCHSLSGTPGACCCAGAIGAESLQFIQSQPGPCFQVQGSRLE